jgi:GT2 family glycosyltransferase
MKHVDIIVLNWNGWNDTINCINSLKKQNYTNFSLIVVDNNSSDDSVYQIKKTLPSVELLQTEANLGFGGGCNVGIKHALSRGADYVWLINSDSIADPNALSSLVHVANQDVRLGSVGSVLYEADSTDQIQLWGGGNVKLWSGQSHHRLYPGAIDFISGASLLLRCTAIKEVGLFDQSAFFMYWEDTDLAFRLRAVGWQLAVAHDSHVWHKQSASLGKRSPLLDEYFTQSGVRFLKRHAPIPFISIFLMLSRMLLKRLAMGEFNRTKAVFKGFLKA